MFSAKLTTSWGTIESKLPWWYVLIVAILACLEYAGIQHFNMIAALVIVFPLLWFAFVFLSIGLWYIYILIKREF